MEMEEELLIRKRQMKCQLLSQFSPNTKDLWQGVDPEQQLLWCHWDAHRSG